MIQCSWFCVLAVVYSVLWFPALTTHSPQRTKLETLATLREELEHLRRQLTWRLRFRSILWSLVILLLGVSLLAWIDFQYQPQLAIFRSLLSISFWGLLLVCMTQILLPTWLRILTVLDVAFAIENQLDTPQREISSSIGLDSTNDQRPLQSDWKKELITRVLDRPTEISVPRVRNRFFTFEVIAVCVILCGGLAAAGSKTSVALQRLSWPNNPSTWPQQTHLRFFDSSHKEISPGSVVALIGTESSLFYVMDDIAHPPADVTIEIKRSSKPIRRIPLSPRQAILPDGKSQTVFDFRLVPNPRESLQFRIVGGDDFNMPWTSLLRELKPAVDEIVCTVTPPDYLNLPQQSLRNWVGVIPTQVGSEIHCDLKLNRDVSQCLVRNVHNQVVIHQAQNINRTQFQLILDQTADQQQTFDIFVNLEDHEHTIVNRDSPWQRVKRIQFEPIPDAPSEVTLLLPQSNLTVTREAVLPLSALATDDHGLKEFGITIVDSQNFILEAENVDQLKSASLQGSLTVARTTAQEGETITVFAQGSDHSPTAEPVVSPSIQLLVVNPATKQEEIVEKLSKIGSDIVASLKTHQEIQLQTETILPLTRQPNLNSLEINALDAQAIRLQRLNGHLTMRLANELIPALVTEMESNRIENQLLHDAMNAAQALLSSSIHTSLNLSFDSLQSLLKISRTSPNETTESRFRKEMGTLHSSLETTNNALMQLIDQLDDWVQANDVQLAWQLTRSRLLKQQALLSDLAKTTVGRSIEQLNDKEQEAIDSSARTHSQLAMQTRDLIDALKQVSSRSWNHLATRLEELQVASNFEDSAKLIRQNSVLQAIQNNQQLLALLDSLEQERLLIEDESSAELVAQLMRTLTNLQKATEQQHTLSQSWNANANQSSLPDEQQALIQEVAEISQQLLESGIQQAVSPLQDYDATAKRLSREGPELSRAELQELTSLADTKLSQSVQRVQESVTRLQSKDQRQRFQQLAELVNQSLLAKQESVILRLRELEESTAGTEKFSRRQRRDFLDVAREERELSELLEPFEGKFTDLPLIQDTILGVRSKAEELVKKLEDPGTKDDRLTPALEILGLLKQLAGISANSSDASDTNEPASASPQLQAQLVILLKRQQDLIQEEQAYLDTHDSIPEELNQKFIKRQMEIVEKLHEILNSSTPRND